MTAPLQHIHFILDADLSDRSKIDEKQTSMFADELMISLKMKPLGKLEIYPATDINFPGFSFVQPITTSHFSGHYFKMKNHKDHFHFDIYSCKRFSWEEALKKVHKYFPLGNWRATLLLRENSNKRAIHEFSGNSLNIACRSRVF